MAASSCERDKSITQSAASLPLSSEELQNVKWFLNDRKMSIRENVTKSDTSAFLKYRLALSQKVKKQAHSDFHLSLCTALIHIVFSLLQTK